MHKCYVSYNFRRAISDYKGVLHCEGCEHEIFLDEIIEATLPEPSLTRRTEMLTRPDGLILMVRGGGGVNFFSTSVLVYPNLIVKLHLIRDRLNF